MSRPEDLGRMATFGPNHNKAIGELVARLRAAEQERDDLKAAIEDYMLWRPGEKGHAEAHRKLCAAVGGNTP